MSEASAQEPQEQADVPAISEIAVSGFKSIRDECRIAIRPLTILAGANSSGKSSIMQPLLLMKQTLEAPYEPAGLKLDGPHVQFTHADQVLTKGAAPPADTFSVALCVGPRVLELTYRRHGGNGLRTARQRNSNPWFPTEELWVGMSREEILGQIHRPRSFPAGDEQGFISLSKVERLEVVPRGGLLTIEAWQGARGMPGVVTPSMDVVGRLSQVIHVPGIRGNRGRLFPAAAVSERFPGTFDYYFASVILEWQRTGSPQLAAVCRSLEALGLTWKVEARDVAGGAVELYVGRLPRKRGRAKSDLVNIADVGLGLQHVLSALVALEVAEPGQLVFIEQPEIHLHPRAQLALAGILAEAAQRGIRAVIETHSDLLLLGVQTAVAQGALAPSKVALHWFWRDRSGVTRCRRGSLDKAGRFGKWPQDFGSVMLRADSAYLDAAERHLFGSNDATE